MTRNSAKMTAAAVVVLLSGAGAINCSKSNKTSDDVGRVSLALMLSGADELDSVTFDLKAGAPMGIPDVTGTIDTSDKNATASIDQSFPPSTGDTVTLKGTTKDGVNCTGTSSPFAVTSGNTASVTVALICGSGPSGTEPGAVAVGSTVTFSPSCPVFTSYSASPLQTSVGGTIEVSVAAADADKSLTLSYAWAPAANFDHPTAVSAKYSCTTAGTQTFTVTASAVGEPTNCPAEIATFTVNCVKVAVCGNGIVEPGEQCDSTPGCDPVTCQLTTGAGGSTGAAGTGAAGTGAAGTGAAGAGAAGTGAAGTGAAGTGAAGTGAGGTGAAGTGAAGTGAAGTGAAGTGAAGTGPSACESCEISGTSSGLCSNTSATAQGTPTDPTKFGCNGFGSTADVASCNALLSCIRTKGCAIGDDPTACLCGTLDVNTCATTSPASLPGVCVAQYVAAADGGNIFGLFFGTDAPVGVANNLFTCDVDNSCTCP